MSGGTLQVLTLNAWCEPPDSVRRTKEIVGEIKLLKPEIICLQEVFSPLTRALFFLELRDDYHIVATNQTPIFPLLSYIFSAILFILTAIVYHLTAAAATTTLPSLLRVFITALLSIAAILFLPQTLYMAILAHLRRNFAPDPTLVFKDWTAILAANAELRLDSFDWSGGMVLARKDKWQSLEVIESRVFTFASRGYPKPTTLSPFSEWLIWWFRMSFVRPGYIITRAVPHSLPRQEMLIVNNHLVIGPVNPQRRVQCEEVVREVQRSTMRFNTQHTLWMGDFNADEDQPELKCLQDGGFYDAIAQLYPTPAERRSFITWDNNNPYVTPGEPDQRLDYIWHTSGLIPSGGRLVTRSSTTGNLLSDHYGVLVDFSITQKSSTPPASTTTTSHSTATATANGSR